MTNYRVGWLRLWIVLSALWLAGAVWWRWRDLMFQDCSALRDQSFEAAICAIDSASLLSVTQVEALQIIIVPPIISLLCGIAFWWAFSGFRRSDQ